MFKSEKVITAHHQVKRIRGSFKKQTQCIQCRSRAIRIIGKDQTPGEYIYKLELLDQLPSHPESKAYIELMEQTGVECVSTYSRWFYFRKKSKDGPFDLNSDYSSCIKRDKKVASLVGIFGFLNLILAILNVIIGSMVGSKNGYYNIYVSIVNWLIVIFFDNAFLPHRESLDKNLCSRFLHLKTISSYP